MSHHTSGEQPRIAPIPPDEMSPEHLDIIDSLPGNGLKGDHAPVNVLGTLMRHDGLVGDFLKYWVTAKNTAKLSARHQELVILRMAVLQSSDYVWGHHVPPALEAGLTRDEINRVVGELDSSDWPTADLLVLQATDALIVDRHVSDSLWAELSASFSDYEVLDLLHVVSQYVLFSTVNTTFRVELEDGIESIPQTDSAGSVG